MILLSNQFPGATPMTVSSWSRARFLFARENGLLSIALVLFGLVVCPAVAHGKISLKPRILVNGQPFKNALVSLYNCKTQALEAGPFAAAQDGSVALDNVDPGDHCITAEMQSGDAHTEVILAPTGRN
jgi:hypothetical protein